VFNDNPVDLAPLGRFDADIRFSVAQLRFGGGVYREMAGRMELVQGRLNLDPISGVSPGGRLEGRFSLDGRQAEPPVSLALSAPGLAVKPLLTALGLPDDATGSVELAADLTAAGKSLHAIAASLSGKIGLAMTDGEIDNRLLSGLVDMLRVAKVPAEFFGAPGSRTKLRCFATRLDAQRGVMAVSAFVLDTGRALVQGGGIVNLGDEILGLRLRPLLRTGGGGVVLPVRVAGPMRQPNVALDSGGAIEGIAGNLAGNIAGLSRNPLAALGQALAGERGGDACGPALAASRAARPSVK
jgi:AsmA protein